MNGFYSISELKTIGFKSFGEDVKISKKASIYNAELMTIGSHVRVDDFCILSGKIKLGSYIHISAFVAMFAGDVGIEMCDFSGISSRCTVYAVSDDYSGMSMTNPTVPDKYRNLHKGKVIIKRHVIIGANSLVLPGVMLDEGSSFGAMTLISKNSEPWSINIGVPFKKIKDRHKNILELEKEFLKEIEIYG